MVVWWESYRPTASSYLPPNTGVGVGGVSVYVNKVETCAKNERIFFNSAVMAPRLFNLLYAISLLIILATFVSIPAHAKREHAKIKSDVLELNWHDTLNSSSYEVLRGPGSAPLTPLTAPFGSIFVAHDSITERASDRHVGTGQGTFAISSFDGFTSFMSFTISLNYDKYLGSLTFVGLLNANATSKIPIVGGTEDFLFAQGYMLYTPPPPKDATTYTLTLTIDLHVYWPLSVSH